MISFLLLSALAVLWWLSLFPTPKYEPVSTEEDSLSDKAKSLLSFSMFSSSERGGGGAEGDSEEYRCGWIYLCHEFYEVPPIDLMILQDLKGWSRPANVYFMVLHRSCIYLYDSEAQVKKSESCKNIKAYFRSNVWE